MNFEELKNLLIETKLFFEEDGRRSLRLSNTAYCVYLFVKLEGSYLRWYYSKPDKKGGMTFREASLEEVLNKVAVGIRKELIFHLDLIR